MATYEVRPLPDGESLRGNWQVRRGMDRVSMHTKKSAAKREARRKASDGAVLKVHRVDGTVQSNQTVRAASVSNGSDGRGDGLFGGGGRPGESLVDGEALTPEIDGLDDRESLL